MKKIFVLILSSGVVLSVVGCQNAQTRAGEGAVIGGILGAAAGGIIGHQSGHGGEGAAIGAAAGALTGALVGTSVPKNQQASGAQSQGAQTANPNRMSIQQVIDLSKQGVHEDVVIDKIRLSNSRFALTATDIAYLKEQGVSQKVIDAMQVK